MDSIEVHLKLLPNVTKNHAKEERKRNNEKQKRTRVYRSFMCQTYEVFLSMSLAKCKLRIK